MQYTSWSKSDTLKQDETEAGKTVRNFHSLKQGETEAGRTLKFFCATTVQHLQMCVCVCVFIKLHITAQPGPV